MNLNCVIGRKRRRRIWRSNSLLRFCGRTNLLLAVERRGCISPERDAGESKRECECEPYGSHQRSPHTSNLWVPAPEISEAGMVLCLTCTTVFPPTFPTIPSVPPDSPIKCH